MRILIFTFFLLSIKCSAIYSLDIPTRINNPEKKYLSADLYSSDTNKPKPTILIQTPYNKNFYRLQSDFGLSGSALPFDTIDYNIVIVDWRGFYGSKNSDSTGYNRGQDGYDIVEWIAKQSWSNGKIGTWGGSALGMIQFQTAAEQPPHLVCAAPFIKDFVTKYEDYYYGGDFRKEHTESLQKLGFVTTSLILSHPYKDNTWELIEKSNTIAGKINIPMFIATGWFDHYPSDVIRAYSDLRTKSNSKVRSLHKFIIGPWLHTSMGVESQGVLNFPEAKDYPNLLGKEFLDFYLLDKKNDWDKEPAVKYFIMGDNEWRTISNWNDISTKQDTLYLNKNLQLLTTPPPPLMAPFADKPDTIIYNPKDPSPTIGGSRFNPFDKSILLGPQDISVLVESRKDILTFTTPEFKEDFKLSGRTTANINISSDREDTDLSIRLCDVFPNGSSIILTQGIKRVRLQDNLKTPELMTPGAEKKVTVELEPIAYTFKQGHSLRIDITSSNYPMFDLNLNNGKELYNQGDTLTATNLIYHSNDRTSFIVFETQKMTTDKIDTDINESINVYPNPARDYINILSNEVTSIKIINYLGLEVQEKNANSQCIYDISNLQQGIYYIKLVKSNGTHIIKPIVKLN